MSLRRSHEDALLTSEEIAMIRQVLAACSNVLSWAAQHGSLQLETVVAEAAQAADLGRSPGGLAYRVNLAIDYLDFAPAARAASRSAR
jgi:hypothetical protein